MTPYLIQRLLWKKPATIDSTTRFGEMFGLDYMGSAEYEFGAFPKNLVRMSTKGVREFHTKVDGHAIHGVCIASHTDEDIHKLLEDVYFNRVRLKESAAFSCEALGKHPPQCTSWMDIVHGVFWTTTNVSLRQIVQSINNSRIYIES